MRAARAAALAGGERAFPMTVADDRRSGDAAGCRTRRPAATIGARVPSPRDRQRRRRARRRRPLQPRRASRAACCSAPGRRRSTPRRTRSSRAPVGDRTRRCLDNLAAVCAAAGADLADAVRCAVYVTDLSVLRRGERGLRRVLPGRAAGAHARSASPSLPLGADVEIDAIVALSGLSRRVAEAVDSGRRHGGRRARGAPPSRAARRCWTPGRSPSGAGRRRRPEGREPAAHRVVQGPRRDREARRARRRRGARRDRGQRGQPRLGGRAGGARSAASRARS